MRAYSGGVGLASTTIDLTRKTASIVAKQAAAFAAENAFRSPITLKFEAGRLNCGFPIDAVGIRSPWIKKSQNANSVNSQAAMNKKMRALENAQARSVKTETLTDGRIRYYEVEKLSKNPGPTKGASYVTEFNPKTGQVRSWYECYDHTGNINRIHPKMIDGQDIIGQHYPPIGVELESFIQKSGGPK